MRLARRSIALCVAAALLTVSARARAQALPPPTLTLTPAESSQLRQLQLKLDDVAVEEAGTSTLLPWALVALGVGAMVLGSTLGLARVASCDESCTSPFWPAWVLVGGATASTGGLIWLRLVQEDMDALQSRRYHLQMQIDGYEVMRQARTAHAIVQVGGTF